MERAFERALTTRKPGNLRVNVSTPGCDPVKGHLSRLLLWTAGSIILMALAFRADARVEQLLTLHTVNWTHQLAIVASKLGEGWVIGVVGVVASFLLFFSRRFEASRMVFMLGFTGLMTGLAATVIRSLLGRTRPSSHELQGFYGVWHSSHWIVGQYEFGAFPSGHVATVVGLAAAAWIMDRRLALPAALYALVVTWSRIALGCHHFSDAVAAAILGIFGAHLILTRLGPPLYSLGHWLEHSWMDRRAASPSSTSPR